MNILFKIHGLTAGGAERVTVSVANGLSEMGHNIYVLTNKVSENDYKLSSNITIILRDLHGSGFFRIWNYTRQLSSIIRKHKIDAVVSINGGWLPLTTIVSKLCGSKIVYSDHNSFERPDSSPMPKNVRRQKFFFSRFCDLTTVLTNRDKEVLGNRTDVVVAPNPLFLPVLNEIPAKEKIVLAVGRQDAWYVKGFDLLIEAWGRICKDFPEWKLRIVGTGSPEAQTTMQNFVSKSKAERVELNAFRSDIEEEYKTAEVFVLSSRFEGFGLVLTEAMSQRCACIACDYLTRQKDIVTDGIDALICEANNVDMLTEKLELVLSDNELRNSLQVYSADNLTAQPTNPVGEVLAH